MAFVSSFTPGGSPSPFATSHRLVCPFSPPHRLSAQVSASASPRATANPEEISTDEVPKTKVRAPRPIRGLQRGRVGVVREQGQHYEKTSLPNLPGLRVASGRAKGKLVSSPSVYLRPMMAKVREALFSILVSLGVVREDFKVLDLFCGSGSVGIEALSRGMRSAAFVDYSPDCADTTRRNLRNCGFEDVSQVHCMSVYDYLDKVDLKEHEYFDLITITPPYEEVDYHELMLKVLNSKCVGDGTFVVVEYPVELGALPERFDNGRLVGVRNRRYGRTMIAIYCHQPHVDLDIKPEEFDASTSKRKKSKRKKHEMRTTEDL